MVASHSGGNDIEAGAEDYKREENGLTEFRPSAPLGMTVEF
jgi:hypothetical protein